MPKDFRNDNTKDINVNEQCTLLLNLSAAVIVVGNEHGDTSSNPGRD